MLGGSGNYSFLCSLLLLVLEVPGELSENARG